MLSNGSYDKAFAQKVFLDVNIICATTYAGSLKIYIIFDNTNSEYHKISEQLYIPFQHTHMRAHKRTL